jgi:hypothetical protein
MHQRLRDCNLVMFFLFRRKPSTKPFVPFPPSLPSKIRACAHTYPPSPHQIAPTGSFEGIATGLADLRLEGINVAQSASQSQDPDPVGH